MGYSSKSRNVVLQYLGQYIIYIYNLLMSFSIKIYYGKVSWNQVGRLGQNLCFPSSGMKYAIICSKIPATIFKISQFKNILIFILQFNNNFWLFQLSNTMNFINSAFHVLLIFYLERGSYVHSEALLKCIRFILQSFIN